MVRQLYLLRHAKSDWGDPRLDDHDRPLAPRGAKAMKAMARHLRHQGVRPALVLCSSARRARETLQLVLPALGADVVIDVEDELYTFDAEVLFRRLRRLPASIGSAMVVGHNPAIQDLVLLLAGSGADLDRVGSKFPTGALATLMIPGSWSRLQPRRSELASFDVPRDLA